MDHAVPPTLLEFASFVEENLGLHGEAPPNRNWEKILQQRLNATRSRDFQSYRDRLHSPAARREEMGQLAQAVTVGETYFFRDSRQFEALTTVILPELLHRRAAGYSLQVLSVACSTGEEPYSVAMAARELLGDGASRIKIYAFDVNPNAIASARRGIYSEWSLRATPSDLRERYFKRQGSQFLLSPMIQEAVQFETRNLFDEDPEHWQKGRFDVILCRNALIYFSRPKICAALQRFTDALAADGTLFLGNAETPRGFEERLEPQEICGSFCYRVTSKTQRLQSAAGNAVDGRATGPVATAEPPRAATDVTEPSAPNDGWFEAIEAATKRLSRLIVRNAAAEATPVPVDLHDEHDSPLNDARQLILVERFNEALAKLDEAGGNCTEGDLLRVSILTNQGRFVESVDLCRKILANTPHSAAAYHWLGVACEHMGRFAEALGNHEMAVTIDPKFAMSHWLLGRLMLRKGRRDAARRHLSTALALWHDEPSTSGASAGLYAGGFGRDALERLCRVDLESCEERR